jgi:hypothetical protein
MDGRGCEDPAPPSIYYAPNEKDRHFDPWLVARDGGLRPIIEHALALMAARENRKRGARQEGCGHSTGNGWVRRCELSPLGPCPSRRSRRGADGP